MPTAGGLPKNKLDDHLQSYGAFFVLPMALDCGYFTNSFMQISFRGFFFSLETESGLAKPQEPRTPDSVASMDLHSYGPGSLGHCGARTLWTLGLGMQGLQARQAW